MHPSLLPPNTQVCRTNPDQKGKYIKIILALLQSRSTAVMYECAVTLVSLSSAPTAVRAAANCFCQLLVSHSDNNVKLIVLDRLQVCSSAPCPKGGRWGREWVEGPSQAQGHVLRCRWPAGGGAAQLLEWRWWTIHNCRRISHSMLHTCTTLPTNRSSRTGTGM